MPTCRLSLEKNEIESAPGEVAARNLHDCPVLEEGVRLREDGEGGEGACDVAVEP